MIVTPSDDKSLDKVLKLIKKDPEELVLDGIDFAAIKDNYRRDDKRSGGRECSGERSGRSRSRAAEPAQAEAAPVAAAQAEAPAIEAPRSRSRRKAKPDVAAVAVVETPAVVEAVVVESVAPVEARAPRPDREPQLLQSDRRGDRKPVKDEPQRQGVRGFGDDIPAFLRRRVVIPA